MEFLSFHSVNTTAFLWYTELWTFRTTDSSREPFAQQFVQAGWLWALARARRVLWRGHLLSNRFPRCRTHDGLDYVSLLEYHTLWRMHSLV